jgi:hypothetical protein
LTTNHFRLRYAEFGRFYALPEVLQTRILHGCSHGDAEIIIPA